MDIKGIENIRSHRMLRKWDIIVLLIFIAVIVALIVVALMPKGSHVEVYIAGELKYQMNMKDRGEYDIDGKLTLVIDEAGVAVHNPNCPDKLCEMQGHISTNGASIVCLPNKITIVIRDARSDVDVVS